MSDKEPIVSRKEIKVEAVRNLIVHPERITAPADLVKVATDTDTGLCTFIFFRKHFNPKHVETEAGMRLDTIDEEVFLEVKVPMNTAFALALYMYDLLKEIRANPERNIVYFGPTSIKEGQPK